MSIIVCSYVFEFFGKICPDPFLHFFFYPVNQPGDIAARRVFVRDDEVGVFFGNPRPADGKTFQSRLLYDFPGKITVVFKNATTRSPARVLFCAEFEKFVDFLLRFVEFDVFEIETRRNYKFFSRFENAGSVIETAILLRINPLRRDYVRNVIADIFAETARILRDRPADRCRNSA